MSLHNRKQRWGVILAGGDGNRLKTLTRAIAGDDRPKQFCRIIGDETLLEQTVRRVQLLLTPAQTLTVVTRTHAHFYDTYSQDCPGDRLLVQPENKGTAAAILLSLVRIAQLSPQAVVAFFPSDHHFTNDALFMAQVELAFDLVEANASQITLLGIEPDHSEVQYGWIEPVSPSVHSKQTLLRVRRFWEKPSRSMAQELLRAGSLWNTFVMVGRVEAFLEMISRTLSNLYRRLTSAVNVLGSHTEEQILKDLYSQIVPASFSREVLEQQPGRLSVLPLRHVGWTDLGEPQRVAATIESHQLHNRIHSVRYLLTTP